MMDYRLEKSRYYLGTAQVALRNLCYSHSSTETDDCSGCCIADEEHNLPALIRPSYLHQLLASSATPERALHQIGPPPRLDMPASVELPCLHGRFRLETSRQNGSSRLGELWVVDLYSSGTVPSTSQTALTHG